MTRQPFDVFFERTLHHFNFLLTEYGFRVKGTKIAGYEAWATFENETTRVIVTYEAGSPPWVEIASLKSPKTTPIDERDRDAVSLELILSSRGKAVMQTSARYSDIPDELLDSILADKAVNLRQEADDLLRGNFDSLPEFRRIAKCEAERREAELFGRDKG